MELTNNHHATCCFHIVRRNLVDHDIGLNQRKRTAKENKPAEVLQSMMMHSVFLPTFFESLLSKRIEELLVEQTPVNQV